MQIVDYKNLEGMLFPAGRRTRVYIGPNGPVQANNFCQGFVTIFPKGSIPAHAHDNEETYTIISGNGTMIVDGEAKHVEGGMAVYIPPRLKHSLQNDSEEKDLIMIYCYSPVSIVDHWQEELDS